jgi:hypothetical protein
LVEKQLKNALILTAFVLAFLYRLILLTWQTFPPGSDIGLHESVIKTITSGKTNFFVNYYHMGGGTSATNPGYHIFVAALITLTGLPDYLSQALVITMFSTITILCVFLIVKKAWNTTAGIITAIFACFSGGDAAMLSWGGYPNIVALMLIPLIFFLFLQKDRFSRLAFFGATSLLIGSLFLTHVFSSLIFVAIAFVTLLLSALFNRRSGFTKKQAFSWLGSIVLGVILVSPYLYNIIPAYIGTEATVTGASIEANQALLETRAVSISILVISVIFGLTFFALSKIYKNKPFSVSAILFGVWLLLPALMTQGALLGMYVDYARFIYFLYLPLMVSVALLALLILKVSKIANPKANINGKTGLIKHPRMFRNAFLVVFSVFFALMLFSSPLLSTPMEALGETEYYRVMTPLKYDAIQWIQNNTSENSVFVADSDFGWLVSGFAQRPTLTANDPQFLILEHEIAAAKAAKNVLSTDYLIDNGLLKINYVDNGTNSLALYARVNSSAVLYPFFSVEKENISLLYRINNQPQYLRLNELPTSNIEVTNSSTEASFTVTNENEQLIISEVVTVQKGLGFAKISIDVQSKNETVKFDWLNIPFISNGVPTRQPDLISFADASMQANISVVLPENQQDNTVRLAENSDFYELIVNNHGSSSVHFEFSVGVQHDSSIQNTLNQNIVSFDYRKTLATWNVSYIVVTDKTMFDRFSDHQVFSLVYKNSEVQIFKINK